jgi:hypothetical protein
MGGECIWDGLLAMASLAYLNDHGDGCPADSDHLIPGPEIALLHPSVRLHFEDKPTIEAAQGSSGGTPAPLWVAGGADHLERGTSAATATTDLTPVLSSDPIEVELRLWYGSDPTVSGISLGAIPGLMQTDVDWANRVLKNSWAGISLWSDPAIGPKQISATTFDPAWCTDQQKYANLLGADFDPAESVIHVVYVDDVVGSPIGKACPWHYPEHNAAEPVFGGLVAVEVDDSDPGTLIHELGHLFGLSAGHVEGQGHTNGLNGFDCWNSMWDQVPLTCPGNRVRFTTGQVFRMHLGASQNVFNVPYNWIIDVGQPQITRICQKDADSNKKCPLLSLDVWRRD